MHSSHLENNVTSLLSPPLSQAPSPISSLCRSNQLICPLKNVNITKIVHLDTEHKLVVMLLMTFSLRRQQNKSKSSTSVYVLQTETVIIYEDDDVIDEDS